MNLPTIPYFETRQAAGPHLQTLLDVWAYVNSLSADTDYVPTKHEDHSACRVLCEMPLPPECTWVQHYIYRYTEECFYRRRTIALWREFLIDVGTMIADAERPASRAPN